MGAPLVLLLKVGRCIWDPYVDEDCVFFQNGFKTVLVAFFFEVEAEIVVLDCNLHHPKGFLWVVDPTTLLLGKLALDQDRAEVELKSLRGLLQIRHDDQRTAQVQV